MSTAMVLGAFLALFAFFDIIQELPDVGKGDYQFHHVLGFVLLTLPGRVYELAPIAALIGTLAALATLAKHSEITVLRAAGCSSGRFVVILAGVGCILAILTFLIGEFVAPPSERMAQQLRLRALKSVMAQEFRSGLWVRDETSFVNVQSVQSDNRLAGVRIYRFDRNYRLAAISEAAEGRFQPPDKWRLHDVVSTVFEPSGTRVERRESQEWASALTPDILGVLLISPERMSIDVLWSYIRHLSENQQRTDRFEIALWKKVVYPLAVIVMMILALPFGFAHDRMGGMAIKVFAGVMLGVLFHLLNGLFSSLGVINGWPPALSALTPSVGFLAAAVAMLWSVERR